MVKLFSRPVSSRSYAELRPAPGPAQSVADTALHVGHREQATLTFGDDIQDHVERDKSSIMNKRAAVIRQGELDSPVAVVEEPYDQGHQAGLRPVDEEGWQVSKSLEI